MRLAAFGVQGFFRRHGGKSEELSAALRGNMLEPAAIPLEHTLEAFQRLPFRHGKALK